MAGSAFLPPARAVWLRHHRSVKLQEMTLGAARTAIRSLELQVAMDAAAAEAILKTTRRVKTNIPVWAAGDMPLRAPGTMGRLDEIA